MGPSWGCVEALLDGGDYLLFAVPPFCQEEVGIWSACSSPAQRGVLADLSDKHATYVPIM